MAKVTQKIAKIRRSDLRKSRFFVAQKMAGKYTLNEHPWKYLTKSQVDILREFGLNPIYLDKSDLDYLKLKESTKTKNPSKPKQTYYTLKFKDEDGEHEARFDSLKEMENYIRFRESCVSSGEEFEIID